MAEKKKDKSAEFARDKSAFAKGGSEKGTASQKAQHSKQKCFASGNNRYLCTAPDYDYDSHIVLWGDVLRWYEYHTGRKLYECSGRD